MPRETPWGIMSYLDYRKKMELSVADFRVIESHCQARDLPFFVSCWDERALEEMGAFNLPCHKIASACLTDDALLLAHQKTGKPIILSTGMSTLKQIDHAMEILGQSQVVLAHSTSAYPCSPQEINLRMIGTLQDRYGVPVGYSGHERGLQISCAAVALGACMVERHLTLDRAMWGTDHAASVEPHGFARLIRDIRVIESALGDGEKKVYESEKAAMEKLRRFH
jgi:N-acetylneuraminate synthase